MEDDIWSKYTRLNLRRKSWHTSSILATDETSRAKDPSSGISAVEFDEEF